MRRLLLTLLLALLPVTVAAQSVLQPSDVTLTGYRDVALYGNDTAYMRGLSHRFVGGELRLLSLTHRGELIEFRTTGAGTITTGAITNRWQIPGTDNHTGIWYETGRERLWVTSSEDYTTVNRPAHITLMTLGANGAVSNVKTLHLNGVNEKRMYGGCRPSPIPAHRYVCGFGGYTSLVAQGGGASMGPTMFGIGDPDSYANGATIPATTILNTPLDQRGLRRSIPVNYFDGGDPRQNPPTRPTSPPLANASWLSPNAQGLGWWVWGDSVYGNAAYIDTGDKRGFVMVPALCKGSCWYQSSTLEFDGRTQELHIWDVTKLGSNTLLRPESMTELNLPRGITGAWAGNVPQANISGVTYVPETRTLYLIGFPLGVPSGGPGTAWDNGRLYAFAVAGTGTPPPVPTPEPEPTPDPTPTPTPDPTPVPPQAGLPAGAVQCAWESQSGGCVFTGTRTVYYGANTTFVSKVNQKSPVACTNANFGGDPLPGVPKHCYTVPPTTTPVPPVEPPPTPVVTLPTVTGTLVPNRCVLTASASGVPSSMTGSGVGVQFRRNNSNHGNRDVSAPYTRSANVETGTYVLTAVWTKTGVASITQTIGTFVCGK